MNVRCIRLISPVDGSEQAESAWVTLEREYFVTSVLADSNGGLQLQIITDDGDSLGWYDATMFLTTDTSMPRSWTASVTEGVLVLAPERWHEPGFWEAYYDREPAATRVFDEELALMRQISDAPSP